MQSSRIKELPRGIFKLKDLEILDFPGNGLENISNELVKLKNLRFINLQNNKLKSIPLGLLSLPHLNHLDITKNEFPDWEKQKYRVKKSSNIVLLK